VMHAGSGAARVDSDTLLCSRTRRRCVLFSVGGVAGVWPIGWLASSASRWARRADGAVGGPLETHTHAGVVGSCVRRAGPCAVSAVACVGFFRRVLCYERPGQRPCDARSALATQAAPQLPSGAARSACDRAHANGTFARTGCARPHARMSTSAVHMLCRSYHCSDVSIWVVCTCGRSLVVSVTSVLGTVRVLRGRSEGAKEGDVRRAHARRAKCEAQAVTHRRSMHHLRRANSVW